jgi:hypothetical protein
MRLGQPGWVTSGLPMSGVGAKAEVAFWGSEGRS